MKKSVSFILIISIFLSLIFTSGTLAFFKGDVNGDNEVNNKDVVILFRYVSGDEKAGDETLYDFNGDGDVNNKDVVSLFRIVSVGEHEHEWSEWKAVIEPTCDEPGSRKRTCALCGETETEMIPAIGHDYGEGGICKHCGEAKPEPTSDEYFYFTLLEDNTYEISANAKKKDSLPEKIIIPEKHDGKPVTLIRGNAFENCISLTDVKIPDSVTEIDSSAFFGCSNLTSVSIPDSVTEIGSSAFSGCSRLKNVTIPRGVRFLWYDVFEDCGSLESISVSDKNKVYCSKGNCIIDKESKTLITGCKNSIIPEDGSVTSIGFKAFSGCTGLIRMKIPYGITRINAAAFYNCSGLKSVAIPDSVTEIEGMTFANCISLTDVKIPDSVVLLNAAAFVDCTGLENVTLGNGITSLSDYIFMGCRSLTSVSIPGSVTSIGHGAFYDCSSLKSVSIPDSVTSIDVVAFSGCSSLTSVSIPGSVTEIGSSAFSDCSSLTNVTIPNSVTEIGSSAFSGCGSLEYNEYGNALYLGNTNNPYHALIAPKDKSITSVNINENTKIIAGGAFFECSALASVTIPEGVTVICGDAFRSCSGLTNVSIPGSVTSIGRGAFYDCSSLIYNEYDNALYLGNTNNPYHALIKASDKYIESIVINENTKVIAGAAVMDCVYIESVIIPDGVTVIGRSAFDCCFELRSVTIPDSVTEICAGAFRGYGLTDINYSGTYSQWKSISRGEEWSDSTYKCTLHCSDGDYKGGEIY